MAGAFMIPTMTGTASAPAPAVTRAIFFKKLRSSAARPRQDNLDSLLQIGPRSPEIHTRGDSTYSLQTLSIPSA